MIELEELKAICDLTCKLTELRQNECKHLSVENVAPEIFAKLLGELSTVKSGVYRLSGAEGHPYEIVKL